jgi:hypothetical protein
MPQVRSSKNTSINISRLPAVYNKVNWKRYSCFLDNYHVIDIGCGRMATQVMINNYLRRNNIGHFVPYDPNHETLVSSKTSKKLMNNNDINKVIICSNVLNVIDDEEALNSTIKDLCDMIIFRLQNGTFRAHPCYITVYEGDKTGIGRETKRDCWQRNERLSAYLDRFNNYVNNKYDIYANLFKIKHGTIVVTMQHEGCFVK